MGSLSDKTETSGNAFHAGEKQKFPTDSVIPRNIAASLFCTRFRSDKHTRVKICVNLYLGIFANYSAHLSYSTYFG
jgi:hypothetical protein